MTTNRHVQLLWSACCGAMLALGSHAFAQAHTGPHTPTGMQELHLPPNGMAQAPPSRPNAHGAAMAPAAHGAADAVAQPARAGVQFGPVGRWWDNKTVAKTVGLRQDQTRRMDSIFNENKSAILSSYQTFLKEQSRLISLSKSPQADKASTFAAIDAVNQARSNLQKATAQMYLQLRQQMDAAQIEKLEKLE